jgi:hypothetical protein
MDPTPTTTTTASTTTTVSIPGGPCDDYSPTNVFISNPEPSPGDTIILTGNGPVGQTVTFKLIKVSDSSEVNLGADTTVDGTGNWSTSLTLPLDLDLGEWDVVASVGDCSVTARIEVS